MPKRRTASPDPEPPDSPVRSRGDSAAVSEPEWGPDCNQVRWESTADCRHCPIRQQALFAALRGPDFEHLLTHPLRPDPRRHHPVSGGRPGAAVYTVSRGLLKLIKGVDGTGGRIVRLLGPGAAAGLETLSTGLYRHTAVAMRQTELCRIPLEVFHALERHNVQLADSWLAELN